jgi:hypothetical protein
LQIYREMGTEDNMGDKAWKAWERTVAAVFGGKRRGAYTGSGGNNSGKTDIIVPGWAIECKLLGRPGFQDLLDASRQAESNRECATDIPVAVVKRKGDPVGDALVVMRLEEFREWFINRGGELEEEGAL